MENENNLEVSQKMLGAQRSGGSAEVDRKKPIGILRKISDVGSGDLLKLPAGYVKPSELSDDQLYLKCQEYGQNARVWTRKFAGLLPEMNKRGIYRRKGFSSIQYFAQVVGGLSEYTVDKILHLAERLKDKPFLLSLLESGAQGWSKIERVSYIATVETEEQLAEKVEILSTRSLEVFVRNYRLQSVHVHEPGGNLGFSQVAGSVAGTVGVAGVGTGSDEIGSSFCNPRDFGSWVAVDEGAKNLLLKSGAGLDGAIRVVDQLRFSCPVTPEVGLNLRVIKQHLEKKSRESLTWNQVFERVIEKIAIHKPVLDFRNCPSCRKNKATVRVCDDCARRMVGEAERKVGGSGAQGKNTGERVDWPEATRHIPIEIRREIQFKYGTGCAFPGCNKPWQFFHHVKRFALEKNHDPRFIVPLCKEHHDLAHAGLILNEEGSVGKWVVGQLGEVESGGAVGGGGGGNLAENGRVGGAGVLGKVGNEGSAKNMIDEKVQKFKFRNRA